ncbi:MAG: hypothetical protein LBL61_00740 [Elusimicrobiota bacterium]|jgi:stage II sporulation protein D|nr:hypothetical protein [Elusimicrobiota bacterium]
MRVFIFAAVLFSLAVLPAPAQSLAELSGGQQALDGSSDYQRHADLEKFNQADRQNELPPLTPLPAAQGPSLMSAARLPDIRLNENVIKHSVMDYKINPDIRAAAALYAAGDAQTAMQKYEDAIVSAEDDETSAQAAGDIAVIALGAGDYKKALHYAEQATQLDKQNPFYQLVKIWILAADGDAKRAKKEYDKLLFLTADFEYVSAAKLAIAQADFTANKQKEAIPALQNLYVSDPYVISHAVYLMGRTAFERGDYKAALTLFEQALAHDTNNYMAQKYSAVTLEKLGRFVPAWQTYASIFVLDTGDLETAKKIVNLSKYLKAAPADYLFYTRLNEILNKEPAPPSPSHMRVGLYAQYNGALTQVQSFAFLPGATFNIKDEKLGKVITGDGYVPKTIIFDKENKGVHIKNKWDTADFSTKRPFVIDLDKPGYTMLIRDVKTYNIFVTNTGDKELRGSLLVIPGESGMTLVNYTSLEDILPSVLISAARGVKEPAALEAAAIALRTRLLAELKNTAGGLYDIPDNTPLFNYGGVNMQSAAAKEAVKNTESITLAARTANSAQPAAPEIYRSCGAVSESDIKTAGRAAAGYVFSPSNLFKYMISNPPKDLISAPQDPTLWSSVKWIYSFPLKDIEARLAQNHAAVGALQSIEPAELSPSGRILAMRFNGKKGSVALPFEEANFILSASTLRSNFFFMLPFGRGAKTAENLFIGVDTGLGNGLCTDGADGMARAGKTAREILAHYYPGLSASK